MRIEIVSVTGTRPSASGVFREFAQGILDLTSDMHVSSGTVVSVEGEDTMFIGEALGCWHADAGTWMVRVKVHDMLTNFQSLMRLRNALFQTERAPVSSELCSVIR